MLDTLLAGLSTNFVNFINYTYMIFVVMFMTTGLFLSYPFLRKSYEDDEKNKKEEMTFFMGLVISGLITLVCVLIMIATPIYAMFQGVNLIDFFETVSKIMTGTNNNIDENGYVITLIILGVVNFIIILTTSGLITRLWGNKIYLKLDKAGKIQ